MEKGFGGGCHCSDRTRPGRATAFYIVCTYENAHLFTSFPVVMEFSYSHDNKTEDGIILLWAELAPLLYCSLGIRGWALVLQDLF